MAVWAAFSAWVLCLAVGPARGENYEFVDFPIPEPKALQAVYKFYVDAGDDVPDSRSRGRKGNAFVDFVVSLKAPGFARPASQPTGIGIELTLIPYSEFWEVIDPKKFCTADGALMTASGVAFRDTAPATQNQLGTFSFSVPVDTRPGSKPPEATRIYINRTDVYGLVLSNCGWAADEEADDLFKLNATITGEVTVMNAAGYLPGDQYYKMQFYGGLSGFYVLLSMLWLCMAISWWRQGQRLHHLHYCITFLMGLGVIEAAFSWYFLYDWNTSSERPEYLFLVNIAVSVCKPIFSYTLVLVTGLGWGITRPDLEVGTMRKVQVVVFVYCVAHVLWEFLSFFRHCYDIAPRLLITVHSSGLLVNVLLFCWMLGALRRIAEDLEGESKSLFKKIRAIMVLGILIAMPTTALQYLELGGTLSEDLLPSRTAFKWHYQWFLYDATGQIIYATVFTAVLCQWAPQNKTERYLYSAQVSQDDDLDDMQKKGGTTAMDENDLDPPPDAFAIEDDVDVEDLEKEAKGGRENGGSRSSAPPQVIGVADD